MSSLQAPLFIARRLAIQLLHEAQIAAPESIHGFVGSAGGQPSSFATAKQPLEAKGESLWAEVFSNPLSPAIPATEQLNEQALTLMISLTTKGVLQMRAWSLAAGAAREHEIRVED